MSAVQQWWEVKCNDLLYLTTYLYSIRVYPIYYLFYMHSTTFFIGVCLVRSALAGEKRYFRTLGPLKVHLLRLSTSE